MAKSHLADAESATVTAELSLKLKNVWEPRVLKGTERTCTLVSGLGVGVSSLVQEEKRTRPIKHRDEKMEIVLMIDLFLFFLF
jgi:hypothetical protein